MVSCESKGTRRAPKTCFKKRMRMRWTREESRKSLLGFPDLRADIGTLWATSLVALLSTWRLLCKSIFFFSLLSLSCSKVCLRSAWPVHTALWSTGELHACCKRWRSRSLSANHTIICQKVLLAALLYIFNQITTGSLSSGTAHLTYLTSIISIFPLLP